MSNGNWWRLPERALFKIFLYLPAKEVIKCGAVCKWWKNIGNNDDLWHKMFLRDYDVQPDIALKPGSTSWRLEYIRLLSNTPLVNTDILHAHTDQVVHVSFSHNGKWFATCSKDATCIVWTATHPATIKHTFIMRSFDWTDTEWAAFNETDTAILICGNIKLPSLNFDGAQVAVYAIDDDNLYLKCRATNLSCKAFGIWFSEEYFLSSNLGAEPGISSSCPPISLNKAEQEMPSSTKPVLAYLHNFYKGNGNSIQNIIVTECPWFDNEQKEADSTAANVDEKENMKKADPEFAYDDGSINVCILEDFTNLIQGPEISLRPASNRLLDTYRAALDLNTEDQSMEKVKSLPLTIYYADAFRRKYGLRKNEDLYSSSTKKSRKNTLSIEKPERAEANSKDPSEGQTKESTSEKVPPNHSKYFVKSSSNDDEKFHNAKYLIYTAGKYSPYQIAIKRINNADLSEYLETKPSLKVKRPSEECKCLTSAKISMFRDNFEQVTDDLNYVDKIIDMRGEITGMALSPDRGYLYVSLRVDHKELTTHMPHMPRLSLHTFNEIDIHVVDLKRMVVVGKTHRARQEFMRNTDASFMFLSVSDDYIVSGAEDHHAYIWDRYYGICLAKYPYNDFVNSVAFSPKRSDLLVTCSNDSTIKVWRSRADAKKLKAEIFHEALELL